MTYIVFCQEEGEYVRATRRKFTNYHSAAVYAATICPSRHPLIASPAPERGEVQAWRKCVQQGGHYQDNQGRCHMCGAQMSY